MQSPPCWGWYVKATMKWLFIVLHLCYTELSFHGNLLGLKSFRYKCLVTWAKILIIPWGCCNVMQDILFSSLSQGIRGYHVLFPALTPRCRYYCEDKEVVEQFRMFFDLLTLSFTILKAPLLLWPNNDAFFFRKSLTLASQFKKLCPWWPHPTRMLIVLS